MALTGKFIADFSSFQDAVQKAEVSLKSLGDGANRVGPQLNRMVDQFSGRKLIQDAELMMRAIEEVGGVTALTAKELQAAGNKAAEASEKMRALGIDVPPAMDKLAESAKPIEKNLEGAGSATDLFTSSLLQLSAAFSIGNLITSAVGTLTDWAGAAIQSAGAIVDLSAKTGFSIEAVQRFGHVASETGTTMEAFTEAATKLGVKIAGGSGSVRDAVKELGLEYLKLKDQEPEAQFAAILEALEKIEDPQERNRVAIELFGNTAGAILPAVAQGYTKIASEATVASEAQVQAIDDAVDAWERFKKNSQTSITSFLGNLLLAADGMRGLTDAQRAQAQSMIAAGVQYDEAVARVRAMRGDLALTTEATTATTQATVTYADELKRAEAAVARLTREQRAELDVAQRLGKSAEELEDKFGLNAAALRVLAEQDRAATQAAQEHATATKEAAKAEEARFKELQKNVPLLSQYTMVFVRNLQQIPQAALAIPTTLVPATDTMSAFTLEAMKIEHVGTAWTVAAPKVAQGLKSIADHLQTGLPQAILGAIQGGGSLFAAAGSSIGNFLLDPAQSGIGKSIATNVAKLPGVLGKSLGAIMPMVGSFIGPAIELATAGFKKLFKTAEKETNRIRETFVQSAGGLDALNQKAAAAGMTLKQMLDAKTPEQYKAAIDALTAAFAFQDQSLEVAIATAERYGFTLAELGPALQRQELDKQAQQLYKDWQILNSAGISTIAITEKMGDEVSAYIQQATAMGTEVPAAMRPMLEQMIEMGTLTDENGNLITDLEDAGVSFALTMSEGFTALISEVGKLTEAITRGLGLAVDTTTDKIKKMPKVIPIDVVYHDPGYTTPGAAAELPGFQRGTEGFRNFGAGTPVMLHGWEAVVPRDTSATAGVPLLPAAAGAAAPLVVHIDARGALFPDPGSEQRLADIVARALTAKLSLQTRQRAA